MAIFLPVPTNRHSPRQNDFQHRTAWFYLYQQACESDASAGAVACAPIRNGTGHKRALRAICPGERYEIPISSERI
jgi:hypothetical protein